MIVIRTLGAPQRRLMRRRRGRRVQAAEPAPVPTTRATLIRAQALGPEIGASAWLEGLRGDPARLREEVAEGARELNAVMRAHRAATADPYARDVSDAQALVVRVGYGSGDQVAEGRFADAVEVARTPAKATRSERLAPQERLAAVLGAREELLAAEELVLRARMDVEAGRAREAALQARIAIEALVSELAGTRAGATLGELEARRAQIGEAANAALRGEPGPELASAVQDAVAEMQRALRRHRAETLQGEGP